MNKLYQYNGRKWVEIAKDGKNGITPVKGVDYFTEQEIESIEKKIREKIKVIHGKDGKDVDESVVNELQDKVNHALSIASRDYDFTELKDVSITNPTNGQVPKYNSTTGKWENGDVSSGGVQSVVAGTNILVDDTDPANPIVSSLSDRYKTTSTTSQAIVSTGTLTFTVVADLAYTTQQDVIIAYDTSNHMHGQVVSYSGTSLVVDIDHKTGSGTYASWVINLDGVPIEAITGATNSTLTQTGTTLGINLGNANNWSAQQNFATALGIGTTTPTATRLHILNPTATYTTITGSVSFSNVVFVGNVTGTGTLFTTEFKVGDFLVHPTQDAQRAMVVRIVSNTSMQILTMNALFLSGSGTGYRRLDRTNAVIDTGGVTMSTESYGQFNTFTGAGNVPTRILNGTTFFQNIQAPQHGLLIDTVATDGRMRIGHSESLNANIIFQQGNANMGINYATLSNTLWSMPLYLGLAAFSSNQTGIYMERSGTGANQQIRQWTTRFAVHGDAPSFQMSANGLDFGRRDGSTWNEGIDAITMSMDKTTGRWKFGSFGTSTPTGATSRVHIVETNGYEQFRLETPYTPTSSADTNGQVGQIAWDDNYTYVKTSTGWKRSALSTF